MIAELLPFTHRLPANPGAGKWPRPRGAGNSRDAATADEARAGGPGAYRPLAVPGAGRPAAAVDVETD